MLSFGVTKKSQSKKVLFSLFSYIVYINWPNFAEEFASSSSVGLGSLSDAETRGA